jgi:hypothetical protein
MTPQCQADLFALALVAAAVSLFFWVVLAARADPPPPTDRDQFPVGRPTFHR